MPTIVCLLLTSRVSDFPDSNINLVQKLWYFKYILPNLWWTEHNSRYDTMQWYTSRAVCRVFCYYCFPTGSLCSTSTTIWWATVGFPLQPAEWSGVFVEQGIHQIWLQCPGTGRPHLTSPEARTVCKGGAEIQLPPSVSWLQLGSRAYVAWPASKHTG